MCCCVASLLLTGIISNKERDEEDLDDTIFFGVPDDFPDSELLEVFRKHYFGGFYFVVTVATSTGFGDYHGGQAWHQRIYGGCHLSSQNIGIGEFSYLQSRRRRLC